MKIPVPKPHPDQLNQDLWGWDFNINIFWKASRVIVRRVENHCPGWMAIHSFIHSLIQKLFIKHQLCARHISCPHRAYILVKTENEILKHGIFLGSKITVDGDCSHKVKRHLLLGRKAMINLHSILKSREIILPTKVCIIKVMVFLGVMYGCESWTIKKAEHQRIDASELWCWKRLLRVPWTARRSNQSILKEINLEYLLEGLMLKLQYIGYLMWRADTLEKTLMLGRLRAGGEAGWEDEKLNGHEFEQALGDNEGQGNLVCCNPGVEESQAWLSDWTTTKHASKQEYRILLR